MNTTTRIEAVNSMLAMIGASPVSSLSGSTSADVAMAESTLDEVSREVQSGGWHYNREYEVSLVPDDSKYIYLGNNVLRVDVEPANSTDTSSTTSSYIDPVQRGNRLYDKKEHTYEFTQTVKATVIYGLDWDELPQPIKTYIAMRAGRIFCDRTVGAGSNQSGPHSFNMISEHQALVAVRNWDAEMADNTIFDHWDVYRVINRTGQPNSI